MQVHSGAPVDLLLGTDLLPHLGFSMVAKKLDGSVLDFLQNPVVDGTPTAEKDTPVMRLIQATKLPPLRQKMVGVKVHAPVDEKGLMLFEPEQEFTVWNGVQVAEAAVELTEEQEVTLILQNYRREQVELSEGHILGIAQLVEEFVTPEVDGGAETRTPESDDGENATVNAFLPQQVPSSPISETEQQTKIADALGLDRADLTLAEHEKLKAAVLDYADLFALSLFELGVTDLVSHSIDTGDHPPVRQPPRRTPRMNIS